MAEEDLKTLHAKMDKMLEMLKAMGGEPVVTARLHASKRGLPEYDAAILELKAVKKDSPGYDKAQRELREAGIL